MAMPGVAGAIVTLHSDCKTNYPSAPSIEKITVLGKVRGHPRDCRNTPSEARSSCDPLKSSTFRLTRRRMTLMSSHYLPCRA